METQPQTTRLACTAVHATRVVCVHACAQLTRVVPRRRRFCTLVLFILYGNENGSSQLSAVAFFLLHAEQRSRHILRYRDICLAGYAFFVTIIRLRVYLGTWRNPIAQIPVKLRMGFLYGEGK